MKALILAAGYTKRHHVNTGDTSKSLLPIAGRPIIELIVEKIAEVEAIDEILIVTNNLYKDAIQQWSDNYKTANKIVIISDETDSYQQSIGAIGDLNFVVNTKKITDDLLIIAGDNFFEFDLGSLILYFREVKGSVIAFHDLKDNQKLLKRFGVIELDNDSKIIRFEEKPETPSTTFASTLCYVLSAADLLELRRFVSSNSTLNTGNFIEYLVAKGLRPIYGYKFTERWFDVGIYEQYRELNQTELKKRFEDEPEFSQSIEAIILFADIIGSATISEYTPEEEYDLFISEFQEIALSAITNNLKKNGYSKEDRAFCEYSARGDEAVLILYTKNQERDIKTVISTAIELKRRCFLSKFNRKRKGKSFYNVAIGIHAGNVVLNRHPSVKGTSRKFNAEGYAINITKRIEGYSRQGKFSKIMLSKRATDLISIPIILSERIDVPLAGIYGSYPIYELQVYGEIDDVENTEHIDSRDINYYVSALESSGYDMWLLLTVARYFYDEEEYLIAQKYYTEAIERYSKFLAGYTYLGRSFYRQNKFIEARRYLTMACELDPLSSRANNFLAIALRRLGEYDLAFQHHEHAIKFGPSSPYEYNSFAYTIAEANRHKLHDKYNTAKAREYLERAKERFEKLFHKRKVKLEYQYLLQHTKGLIDLVDAKYTDAIDCFNRALNSVSEETQMMPKKREEKRLEIYYHIGLAYFKMEHSNWKDARKNFELSLVSVEIDKRDGLPYYWFKEARENILAVELGKSE